MSGLFTGVSMFVSAYAVLFMLMAIRIDTFPGRHLFAAAAIYGALVAIFALFITPRRRGREPTKQVDEVQDRGAEVAGYLVAYLLPFVVAPSPTATDLTLYGVFLFVLCVVYVRSSLLYMNPLFYLLGRRAMAVKFSPDDRAWTVVIAKHELVAGDVVSLRHLSSRFVVEV